MNFRNHISDNKKFVTSIFGLILILIAWYIVCIMHIIPESLLPMPHSIILSYRELQSQDFLLGNMIYSIKLNLLGYLEATLLAVPLGFLIGLSGIARGLFSKYIDAIRFVPLTACMGLFIAWWGIDDMMKIQFLSFGIFVYLLPVVVQRVDEVENIYIDTIYTLGANRWQTIKNVFIPAVLSKLSDDVRVLTAISWTYLIVAELVNKTSGLGALSFTAARQSRVDKVFAVLLLIILIGIVQDKIFKYVDKILFKFKFEGDGSK